MKKVSIKGQIYNRIPCGNNDHLDYNKKDGTSCKDCGVNIGEYHKPHCEAEQCPAINNCEIVKAGYCGGQLCGCELNPVYL